MNAIGLVLTAAFCLLALSVPIRGVPLVLLAATLYITQGQALSLGGLNMVSVRFVEIAVLARILPRARSSLGALEPSDKLLTATLLAYVLIYAIRDGEFPVYAFGLFVDGAIVYYAMRILFKDPEAVRDFLAGASLLLIPMALFMIYEGTTGRNLFAFMGGVPESPVLRDGYYRCQATFRHSITAGSVGATFLPLFAALFFVPGMRRRAIIGGLASLAIVLESHSSGPLMATIAGASALLCWPMRYRMRLVRTALLVLAVLLQLNMSRPIWFIFDRISGIVGGDGWHRSNLIDQFVRHFDEWALVGMPIEQTSHWAATQMPWGGVDVTNYYVALGISGGLISFLLFLGFLHVTFRAVGRALPEYAPQSSDTTRLPAIPPAYLLWGAASAFLAHAVNLTAVTYWDQSYVIWYMHAALVVSLASKRFIAAAQHVPPSPDDHKADAVPTHQVA